MFPNILYIIKKKLIFILDYKNVYKYKNVRKYLYESSVDGKLASS